MDPSDTDAVRRRLLTAIPAVGAALLASKAGLISTASAAGLLPAAASKASGAGMETGRLLKIGLEEHFMIPEFLPYLADTKQNINPALYSRAVQALSDFGSSRLDVMDSNGINYVILSLSGPGVQVEPDAAKAHRLSQLCNDRLAAQVHKRPDRYGGFAHLAMQNPAMAADELERCVKQLGFQGALINGATNGIYLDDRRYDVFWERVEALDAPIYIHPANPFDTPAMYKDHPELWGPTWSWAVETCTHAMRLIFSGVFDRHPRAKVILGHMGETLPIQPWRLDSRYAISNHRYEIKKQPSEYVRSNIYITTSGVCSDPALKCSLETVGEDKVMFSIDYPFEKTDVASRWIDNSVINAEQKKKVASQNAIDLFHLDVNKIRKA